MIDVKNLSEMRVFLFFAPLSLIGRGAGGEGFGFKVPLNKGVSFSSGDLKT
jgi:hypothetical protein